MSALGNYVDGLFHEAKAKEKALFASGVKDLKARVSTALVTAQKTAEKDVAAAAPAIQAAAKAAVQDIVDAVLAELAK
jgi:hypothetical protein